MKTSDPSTPSARRITLLFAGIYMVSYISRVNYAAILPAMETALGISKSGLSLSLLGSFICYGAGQILSGICGDRFPPKLLVAVGLFATAGINALLPLCRAVLPMVMLWSLNGLAQAMLWPPLVKLMSGLLSGRDYQNASTRVSFGSSLGSIAVYLFAPLLLAVSGWQAVFYTSAGCALLAGILWCLRAPTLPAAPVAHPAANSSAAGATRRLFSPLLLGILLAIALQGILRDGVSSWMPSYVKEVYGLGTGLSILTGVVLPLSGMLFFQLAKRLYQKRFSNPVFCAGVFFGAGSLAAATLLVCFGRFAGLSVLLLGLLIGCMHGVNLLLICMIPPYYADTGKVSTVSGILNSCTYLGSAVSTYGFARLTEWRGWHSNLLLWLLVALLGTLLCLLLSSTWRKAFAKCD